MLKRSNWQLAIPDTRLLARSILERRNIVLALLTGITLVLASFIPHLRFSTSVYDLIIEDIPEAARYAEFKQVFGSEELIRIVVKCDDVFEPASFAKITELAEAAGAIAGVQRVISLPGIKQLVDPTDNWPPERFKAHIAGTALFQHNLISRDHTTSAITLVLADASRHSDVIFAVDALIAQSGPNLSLYQIGMPLISQALAQFTRRDFLSLPPITFILITIMLLAIYRRLSYVLIPLLCVILPLVWTLGFIGMSGKNLSILTMIVPVFLIAVGTAYCMHIVNAHRHNLKQAGTSADAVIETMSECTLPTILAIITTIIGLASLFINRIDAVREFALFACLGMFGFIIILLAGMPVALSFLAPAAAGGHDRLGAPRWIQRILDSIIHLNLDHHKPACALLGVIALISLAGLPRLRVETNPVDYFRPDTEVIKNFHDIYRHLSGSFPVNIDIQAPDSDYFEDIEQLGRIDQLAQYAETLPGVDKAIAFTSYLKLVNYASNRFEPEYYRLPEESYELRMLINSYRSMLGADMLNAFMDEGFARTNILLLTHISNSRDFLELRRKITSYSADGFPAELKWDVTGFGMVISASSHYLVSGQIKSLSLTLSVTFGIMFLLFLSFRVGLVALVPNIFPIVVNFGLMGWLGIELSMGTVLIASIAIGLAVDDTIHYMVTFNREFKKDLDERRAMRTTLTRIGQPVIFTTLTVSLGFAVLIFSSFKPTSTFGTLMVITMLSALAGDLIILPSLLRHVELVTLWDLVRIKMGRDPSMQIPLLHGLSRAEVHSILMAGTIRNIAAGEILFRKGDPSDSMYAVVSGRFEVIDYEGDGKPGTGSQKSVNSICAGDILGEMGLLRQAPRSATVIARENGELLPINWAVLKRIQWLYPPTVIKLFCNLLNILCGRVERLTHCLANESVVDDLTHLCNRKGFCNILETEVRRASRRGEKLSLHLLTVNPGEPPDQRECCDEILSSLAERLTGHIRDYDTLTRLDGRTLGLLTACDNTEALSVLRQRLEQVIEMTQTAVSASAFSISLTMVDVALAPELNGAELLSRALAPSIPECMRQPDGEDHSA